MTIGELHDSLEPGGSTYLRYGGQLWEVTRLVIDRIEDEGLTPRQMDEERARDEGEADWEAAQAWREGRDE